MAAPMPCSLGMRIRLRVIFMTTVVPARIFKCFMLLFAVSRVP